MKIILTLGILILSLNLNAQSVSATDSAVSADDSIICKHPDIQAKFQGNLEKFFSRNMTYPKDAIKNEIQGTIIVKFTVEKDGSLTNIEAESGPHQLRENAIDLIKKMVKWDAAICNGKKVKSVNRQPIVYRLDR